MEEYPRLHEEDASLVVQFTSGMEESTPHPLRVVLDFGQSGEVVGIEIINLAFELGKNCLGAVSESVPKNGEGMRYGYDEESDCFYLRLRTGRSLNQKAVDGAVFLDSRGEMVALNANWSG